MYLFIYIYICIYIYTYVAPYIVHPAAQAKMGVEAREQISDRKGGMEDARITRSDHPLVRYAEAFTENFDLIAERKGVIYQLRELAKASVLAKFLMDSQIPMEDFWFSLADGDMAPCPMEVPQLWNERCYGQIQVTR